MFARTVTTIITTIVLVSASFIAGIMFTVQANSDSRLVKFIAAVKYLIG